MTAGLEADAELEIGPGMEILAGLSVQLGNFTAAMERQRRDTQDQLNREPRYIKDPGQTMTLNGSGNGTLDLGGPLTGYQWTVRRVNAGDALSATTATSGKAYVYAGQTVAALTYPKDLECVMSSLPDAVFFGSDQMIIHYGEHLFVQFVGANAAQVVQASHAYQLYAAGVVGVARVNV